MRNSTPISLRSRLLLCAAFTGVSTFGLVRAQEPMPPAAAPAAPAAAGEEAAAPPPTALPPLSTISDPLIRAMLANNPTTPAELMRAIKVIIDRRQPAIARPLVERLLQANLDPEAAAQLREAVGTATLLQLARVPELQPAGGQLATAILTAADTYSQDPARLAAAVDQLRDPAPSARRTAFRVLQQGGVASVAPLVAALADPARASEHAVIREALVALGRDTVAPLVGALDSPDAALRAQVIAVLARLGAQEGTPYLLAAATAEDSDPALKAAARDALLSLVGRIPTAAEAAMMLTDNAEQRFEHSLALSMSSAEQTPVWMWNAEQGQSVATMLPSRAATTVTAARLAAEAWKLTPGDSRVRRLYLATLLEAAVLKAGLDQPLPESLGPAAEVAIQVGANALEDALRYALDTDHVPAATAAVALLGRTGLSQLVEPSDGVPRPLVAAARHCDPRLRFAAVNAILSINPSQPFVGASFVTDGLQYFAASTGARRALVAAPRQDEARRIGALLIESGQQTDVALDDRSIFQQVQSVPDYELLLVDIHVPGRPIEEVLQQLSRDSWTGALPVGVIASPDDLPRAQNATKHHPRSMVFVRPVDPPGLTIQVQALSELVGPFALTPAERLQYAQRSLEWLARLTAQPRSIYNLREVEEAAETALYVPELTVKAIPVLANLAMAKAQRALVELASRAAQPLDVRQQAASAFAHSVARHGILLTSAEILAQYDRYNRSETADEATQQVLGQLLDAIESRNATSTPPAVSHVSPQELPAAASR